MKVTVISRKKHGKKGCGPLPCSIRDACIREEMSPAGGGIEEVVRKPELLLHSCCGPCSTSVIDQLAGEYVITVFFYNPCITDEDEYIRRRSAQKEFIQKYNEKHPEADRIRFLEGKYQPAHFFRLTEGLEEEPEGGARCEVCFRQRLEKTAEMASLHAFDYFTTTLNVSPYKDRNMISEIGREIGSRYGLSFLDRDFRKKDGYRRSVQMSKEYGLYRQNYCGCEFSKRDAGK